jgi:pimeloyl-ACP methyl ester carboxylesterase
VSSISLFSRLWRVALIFAVLAIASVATVLYWFPLWTVNQSQNLYMFRHGVDQHDIAVGEYQIHYLEAKPHVGGPDKPLLLIHGLGARATNWTPLIPELAANGYHVYALDLLGYGDSPKPANGDYSLAGEEKIVLGFLQAMNISKADVAGWSMGGWVAMKVALDRPDLVRRLMLYDSAGLYFKINFPLSLFVPTTPQEFEKLIYQIEPDKPFVKTPTYALHGMLRQMKANQPIVDASFRSMLTGSELLDFRVHALKMPVLIVWGTEDKLIPISMGLRLHELVPQSVFVGIAGCGHLAVAECAGQAAPVTLKFLAADPPQPPSITILPSAR